jgi:UDP-N-acetylmuramate dehydrogenase
MREEPLSRYTSFGLGGTARYYVRPGTREDFRVTLQVLQGEGTRHLLLGGGTNLIPADGEYDGVVVHTCGLRRLWRRRHSIVAEAGVALPRLLRAAERAGLSGLEALAGIPGTVGGAVVMNAGGKWGAIGERVHSVRVCDGGEVREIPGKEISFRYRGSSLLGRALLEVNLALEPDDPERIRRRRDGYLAYRRRTQPLGKRSAGCIFKNPAKKPAGALIEEAGLKGCREGGAIVSRRHANFILNDRCATARDVRTLIRIIREAVRHRFHVELELEVKLL